MARKMPRIVRNPTALRDVVEIADYLAIKASLATANRFIAATDRTLRQLARMPGMGTAWDSEDRRLAGVRFFPVTKFRNHLVFYRVLEDGIELIRVVHGARDIESIFGGDS